MAPGVARVVELDGVAVEEPEHDHEGRPA